MLSIQSLKKRFGKKRVRRRRKRRATIPLISGLAILTLAWIIGSCSHTGKSPQRRTSRVGLHFKVPVRKGDRVEFIAKNFMIPAARIRALNHLPNKRSLKAGSFLIVPVSTAALKSPRIRMNYPIYDADSSIRHRGIPDLGKAGLAWPVDGIVTWSYGQRDGRPHQGLDISAREGTKIAAVQGGKVAFAGWKRGYGWTVIVDHQNFKTLYAHCRKVSVREGQFVKRGALLGFVGQSGNADGAHLHFEYRSNGNAPLDPLPRLALNYGH